MADNDVVKNTVYNQLVTKVNFIDNKIPSTSGLVSKTQYDSHKKGLDKKFDNVNTKLCNTSN